VYQKGIALICALMFLSMALFILPNVVAESGLTGNMEPIHLNMKESNDLSPETWGDNTREAVMDNPPRSYTSQTADFTRTREWKDVGTWTAMNGNVFDISLGGPVKFNLWWRETDQGQNDDYDAQVQYRFRLNIAGQEAAFYSDEGNGQHECAQSKPCEWTAQVNSINVSSAPKDTIFEIEIEYWAYSDIEIYYDNASFDSGAAFSSDAIKFGQSTINGQTVGFDFIQAWDTDAKEAVDGNYIRLLVDGVGLNSSNQRTGYPIVEDGKDYDLNGTSITSTKIIWYIDDEYAKVDQSVISFSLTKRSSGAASPIDVKALDIIGPGGVGNSEDDEGLILGIPGFELIIALFSIVLVSFYRREV
tara:strand:+ start:1713 stop:2795 length:1083 start_codon:yes stop_codon:yes gene_type:complete